MLTVAGMFGMFFLGSLYLERILGYDALQIGLAFLPVTIVMGTLSVRFSEPLITRFGARTLLFPGLTLVTVGLVLFTQAPVDGSYALHVLPVMILLGTGIGVCFPALMTIAMSGATQSDAGLASGLVNTSAQVGGALGLAVLATLSASRSDTPDRAGTVHGGGLDQRLPPRLLDRGRPGCGGDRGRPGGGAAGGQGGGEVRGRARAGPEPADAEPAYSEVA